MLQKKEREKLEAMGATDNFFEAIKNVMLLTNEVKGLTKEVIDHSQEVREIDRRLIRIKTMIEIAQGKRIPGIDILRKIT
jgi:predicted  nucleic acid-binding Zn-ribbon protein